MENKKPKHLPGIPMDGSHWFSQSELSQIAAMSESSATSRKAMGRRFNGSTGCRAMPQFRSVTIRLKERK